MKNEEKLLSAVGGLEDRYWMEAMETKKRPRRARRAVIGVAAAVAVMVTGATAFAASSSLRDTVRGWLGVDGGGFGYEEYADRAATLDNMDIRLVSELCTGSRQVAWFQVTSTQGELDTERELFVQYQDEDQWRDGVKDYRLEVLSASPEAMELQLTTIFDGDLARYDSVPVKFGYMTGEKTAELSEVMALDVVDTPTLLAEPETALYNEKADSTGVLKAVQLTGGSLELVLAHEYAEGWCTRVCVPDGGARFCKAVYGEDWQSRGVREEPAYFSPEDEAAILTGFEQTWVDEALALLDTVKVTLKDGTVLELGDPDTVYLPEDGGLSSYSSYYSDPENRLDAFVYGYTFRPLIDVEDVASVGIAGEKLDMKAA